MLFVLIILKLISVNGLTDTDILSKFHQNEFKFKFERIELAEYSKEAFITYNIVTFKYNRTNAAVNLTFIQKFDTDINTHIVVQVYKFLSNEYRIFPIHFQAKFINAMKMNMLGIQKVTDCGNTPSSFYYKKGVKYHVCNFAADENKFPPLIPNGDYKMEIQFFIKEFHNAVAIWNCFGQVFRPIE